MIPLEHILSIAGALFGVGLLGLLWQKNVLRLLLAVEAMFNGSAFGFIGTAVHYGKLNGHIMFFLVLTVAAAEVCIALAIVLNYDRWFKNLDMSLAKLGE